LRPSVAPGGVDGTAVGFRTDAAARHVVA
jgi:hypothetical protein